MHHCAHLNCCRHKYTLFLAIDGNYRAVLKKKRHDVNDVPLLDGRGYFVESSDFAKYVKTMKDDPEEVLLSCGV